MKHDTKLMLTAVGCMGALGALAFWGVKRAQAAKPPASQPQAVPAAVPFAVPQAKPEVQVSPGPAAAADVPPEQWTQEQASEVTAYQGNEARDTIGKVFGF